MNMSFGLKIGHKASRIGFETVEELPPRYQTVDHEDGCSKF